MLGGEQHQGGYNQNSNKGYQQRPQQSAPKKPQQPPKDYAADYDAPEIDVDAKYDDDDETIPF